VFQILTMGQGMWMDKEVDILVEAYAKAYRRSLGKLLTVNDWAAILNEENQNNIGKSTKKNTNQVRNKRDALIKYHRKEHEKQFGGEPSSWKYFDTMEEVRYIRKHGKLNYSSSESVTSFNSDSSSDSDVDQILGEELDWPCEWKQCSLQDSKVDKIENGQVGCDLSLDGSNFLSEVESMFSFPDVEESSVFIRNIKSYNSY
jgi:hypothetical protein